MASLNFGSGTSINLGTFGNTVSVASTNVSYSMGELRYLSSSLPQSGSISLSSLKNTNLSLFKFPPSSISSSAQISTIGSIITNAREGNGLYYTYHSTTTSGTTNLSAYQVFSGDPTNTTGNYFWVNSISAYDTTTGSYTGTQGIAGFSGEWVKLQCPSRFTLKKYRIYPHATVASAPGTWRVYGSNNNTNWTIVDEQSTRLTAGWTLANYNEYTINATTIGNYLYYSLVINANSSTPGSSSDVIRISEWELYGIPSESIQINSNDFFNSLSITTAGSTTFTAITSGSAPNIDYQMSQFTTSNTELSLNNPLVNTNLLISSRLQDYNRFTASFEIKATNATSHSINFFVGSTSVPTITTGNIVNGYNGFVTTFNMANSNISLIGPSGITVGSQIADATWENNQWYPVKVDYIKNVTNTWRINANGNIMTYDDPNNSSWVSTTSGSFWGLQTLTTTGSSDTFIRRVNIKTNNEKYWTAPGTYLFMVPSNVTSASTICIGGGGGGGLSNGNVTNSGHGGGGGGALYYANNFSVTSGSILEVKVGEGGTAGITTARAGGNAGDSYVAYTSVINYPPAVMTANTTSMTLVNYGSGTYIASGSTENGTMSSYYAFDGNTSTYWESTTGSYNTTTGSYTGSISTTVDGTGYAGEYLQLQLPTSLSITGYKLTPRGSFIERVGYDYVLAGSNNNITWSLVDSKTSQTYTADTEKTISLNKISNAWNYYRLIITKLLPNSANSSLVNISEWVLQTYGHPKMPSLQMTADSTGSFVASASSVYNATSGSAFQAFEGYRNGGINGLITDKVWHSAHATYSTGNYIGAVSTTVGSIGYAGEWLQIQLPQAITLSTYTIFPRTDSNLQTLRSPVSFVVAGSNDGSTWTSVDTQSGLSWTGVKQFTVSGTPSSYSYYRMIIINVGTGANGNSVQIAEWELNSKYYCLAIGGAGGQLVYGGHGGNVISCIGDSGGSGGAGTAGAQVAGASGGAGGYRGNGGSGGGVSGTGGGGGAGGRWAAQRAFGGGGGVGIFGQGANGAGGINDTIGGTAGGGGSGGSNGDPASGNTPGNGGLFGGGGGSPDDAIAVPARGAGGARGAVRITWF